MVAKDLISFLLCLTSSLVFVAALPASDFSLTDDNLLGSQDFRYAGDDVSEPSLPSVLRLLNYFVDEQSDVKPSDYLHLHKPSHYKLSSTGSINQLKSLLHQLSAATASSASSGQGPDNQGDMAEAQEQSYQESRPVREYKRARENSYGAMPPLNELCRLMNVNCF